MRIFVVCDAAGNIRSVAFPNAELASGLGMETEEGGHVHVLDVSERELSRKALLDPATSEAQEAVYARLRSLIERPASRPGGPPRSRPTSPPRRKRR